MESSYLDGKHFFLLYHKPTKPATVPEKVFAKDMWVCFLLGGVLH